MNSRDAEILNAQDFFINRRDVGSESKEELIEDALNEDVPLEKLSFYNWKDRKLIKEIRERCEAQFC